VTDVSAVQPTPRQEPPASGDRPAGPLRAVWSRGLGLSLPVVLLLTSGCVKTGVSSKAHETHSLFYIVLWLALPVFIFVEGMLLICVIWFRKKPGDESEPIQDYGNNRALLAFFAGPLVLILILLGFGESTLSKVDHTDPHPDVHVTVTGFQWQWSAAYTDEGFTVTGKTLKSAMVMELPVNESALITLKSTDVMHAFYVPDLLFMTNAIPGHPNVFSIEPTKLGTYRGQCTQFCGLWHPQMRLVLKVVTPAQYKAWTKRQKKLTSATGHCSPTGSAVTLVAQQIAWDKKCIAVEANKPFTVTIDNKDAGIAHDFAIWANSKLKHQIYAAPKVTGVATKTFTAPALPAGTYYFQCNVHGPAMSGTLIVG
jgi:cytochrome c oxidase subunit 2